MRFAMWPPNVRRLKELGELPEQARIHVEACRAQDEHAKDPETAPITLTVSDNGPGCGQRGSRTGSATVLCA